MLSKRYILLSLILLCVSNLKAQSVEEVMQFAKMELALGHENLRFDMVDIPLGKISEDANNIAGEFSFTNVGEEPLVLTKVVSSCSCLVVDYPKEPIVGSQRAKITFKYHPKGFPGYLQRRVFVYTNLSNSKPTAVLELTGFVEKSSDPTINYRYSMGALYLKQKSVSFRDGSRVGVERINCYNSSGNPMTLKAMAGFLPRGLSFYTEPEVIPAHGEGELIIRHDPKEWTGAGAAYKVIIDGLSGKPSQRSIDVKFDYKNN